MGEALHHSQKLLKDDLNGKIFSIKVVLNFELERELLGFGTRLRVLGPRILRKQIKQNLAKALAHYDAPVGEDTDQDQLNIA